MLIVKKRKANRNDFEAVRARLATKSGFAEGFFNYKERPVTLYPYQREEMGCRSRFTITTKARQTGWSFEAACDALAKSLLSPGSQDIFVSINLMEAKEKIRYARDMHEELDSAVKVPLITDNKQELEFANGSRIISHPCREPRGKSNATIWLDEFAHYKQGKAIYDATIPILIRGGGQLHIGSTPLGKTGTFAEIALETIKKYPGYARFWTYWWDCRDFTNHPLNEKERLEASQLPTAERVERFGNQAIKEIYQNMDGEEFQREFECLFLDESSAFISYETILRAQDHDMELLTDLDSLLAARKGVLYAGYDVGRKGHASELIIADKVGNKFFIRLRITLQGVEYEAQRRQLQDVMNAGAQRLAIDTTGIGDNLAEDLEKEFGSRVERITFTPQSKEFMASNFKKEMEITNIVLPADRALLAQIHSIKKIVTVTGNIRYDCDKNEKHHADQFWAAALAIWAGKSNVEAAGAQADIPTSIYQAKRKSIWDQVKGFWRTFERRLQWLSSVIFSLLVKRRIGNRRNGLIAAQINGAL